MKEEALKLADMLDISGSDSIEREASAMIRRLVEELEKPLSNDAIDKVIHELRQRTFDPNRWIDIFSVAVETIIAQREELSKQTKPLSDEEIDNYTKAYFNIHPEAKLSEQFKIKLYELQEFAKAIEERHGIK